MRSDAPGQDPQPAASTLLALPDRVAVRAHRHGAQ